MLLSIFLLFVPALGEGFFFHDNISNLRRFRGSRGEQNDLRKEKSDSGDSKPLILTPYIEQNKLKEAREAARVTSDLFSKRESYSGYFTVNKEYNGNLFFWYFPVAGRQVEDTPWIIWLQGGPGGSSMFGLFNEIGPYSISVNGSLDEMEHSWATNHSLLFIDNPIGTGFSFADNENGFATNQTTIGEELYSFLQQFLTVFPELRRAPLTIAGESYAGKHIPSLGIQIHWNRHKDQPINLHGLAIGDGYTDPQTLSTYSYFLREIGFLDDHTADQLREHEIDFVKAMEQGDYDNAKKASGKMWMVITSGLTTSLYNYLDDGFYYGPSGDHEKFLNQDNVQDALHVGRRNFQDINEIVSKKLGSDFIKSAKPWLEELISNYKVLCYNGQLDVIVAYHVSVNTYLSLKFPGSENLRNATRYAWCNPHTARQQPRGYFKTVNNFTEMLVLAAGHMVPQDQPEAALEMITAFTRDLPYSVCKP